MSIWVIIPVKPLNRAKSRLESVLTPDARARLSEFMFRRVLAAVKSTKQVAGALVISRDQHALAIARELGAHTLQESGNPELNTALTRATQVVIGWKGSAVLILPADLPLVTAEDVAAISELGLFDNTIVIATDSNRDGTNALFTRPAGIIEYAYGPSSFSRHIARAEAIGARVKVYESERLALDIDVPSDLEIYRRLEPEVDQATAPNNVT
ncbi:MAG: 2-phospho-L-lactate guanylyltransferase [Chloroflexi bacterium]|nr:2-phospho-L-lactate guanylyltransferase [Chloroflexota bacterium]